MMRMLCRLISALVVVCALGLAFAARPTPAQEPNATDTATPTVEVRDGTEEATLPNETNDVFMFRGNPGHTGEMPGPDPEGQIGELWRVETGQEIWSSPAVVDGVVYIGTGGGHDVTGAVLALDAVLIVRVVDSRH
jgi:outer membrane protein assembly factor BamB